jgi:hypothetical protein
MSLNVAHDKTYNRLRVKKKSSKSRELYRIHVTRNAIVDRGVVGEGKENKYGVLPRKIVDTIRY